MRIRIRGPNGQSLVMLADNATIQELKVKIEECTAISHFDVKFSYPPKELRLEDYPYDHLLSDLHLDGEQLIISKSLQSMASWQREPDSLEKAPVLSDKEQNLSNVRQAEPLSPTRKSNLEDPPELPMPSHNSTLTIRIMPDDNSCLFRAFNSAYFGPMDNMLELRSIIAQTIQGDPETYSAVVLERTPDDYCRWIQRSSSWGGQVELQILSQHFQLEICSIDVQTLRVDRYNKGQSKRCILVYSGVHYDVITLIPFQKSLASPEFDTKIFEAHQEDIVSRAQDLCRILQERGYYTDTAGFSVRCNQCGGTFSGERGAVEHASATGHNDFGEA